MSESKELTREELFARKKAREEKQAASAPDLELVRLRLEDKYETELGPQGKAFAIVEIKPVDTHPYLVVKVPETASVIYKRFAGIPQDKLTPEDLDALVAPCVVHPSLDEWRGVVAKRPGNLMTASGVVLALLGVDNGIELGK